MEVWLKTFLFFLLIFLFLIVSEILRKREFLSPEGTRKFVHIGVGVLILVTPLVFEGKIPLILLSLIFVIINGFALLKGGFKGIHGVERRTIGTVLYPLAVLLSTLLYWGKWYIFYPSLSALFFGDAAAAHFGEKFPIKKIFILNFEKSIGGFTAMTLFTFIPGALFLYFLEKSSLLIPLFLASIFATVIEFSLSGGTDNLFVPISLAIWLLFFETGGDVLWGFISLLFSLLITLIAYRLRTLTTDGALYTFLLGFLLLGMGGIKWVTPILVFFSTSSFLTKLLKGKSSVKPGEARNSRQVLANGGLAGLFLLLETFLKGRTDWFLLYLVSVAVVTSDTWSTEIGTLSKKGPRALFSMKRVPKGSSGAISMVGSFGGILGALLIGSLSTLFGYGVKWVLFIGIIGLIGNFLDSILGATVEVQYICKRCGGKFDVNFHCNSYTKFLKGFKWFGNNLVNFSSSFAGVLIALFFMKQF